jgi:DNA-binding transcriptional regulator YhcF (GntR family)
MSTLHEGLSSLASHAVSLGVPEETSDLDNLDPDDPRPPSQQIANLLRAAIRTGKIRPGEQLPSQPELAERYNVARETVKAALRILRDEYLVVTRQGSGTFVRAQTERPVGLRPHIEAAFESPRVSIDFAGFSGETLNGALSEPLDKIRAGRLTPEAVSIRMLLPDLTQAMALPSRVDGGDSQSVRSRVQRIAARSTENLVEAVGELADLGLVKSSQCLVRTYATSPLFKLYILNDSEAFFGFYPVVKHVVSIDGQSIETFDPMGKDATLFHFTSTNDEAFDQYVEQARLWFDSIWNSVGRDSQS